MFGLFLRLRPCFNSTWGKKQPIPQDTMPRKPPAPNSPQHTEKMVARLQDALTDVYCAIENVPFSEPPGSQLRKEFWGQSERLRNKLVEVGGTETLFEYMNMLSDALSERKLKVGWFGSAGHNFIELNEIQMHHEMFLDRDFQLPNWGAGPCNHPKAEKLYEAAHGIVRERMHYILIKNYKAAGIKIDSKFLKCTHDMFIEAARMVTTIHSQNTTVQGLRPVTSWCDAVSSLESMVQITIAVRYTEQRAAEIQACWEC